MQNYPNSQNPQNPQFSNSRSGPAFTSPEQQRPVQYTNLQNSNLLRGTGFTSPLQGAGAPAYPFYQQGGSFPVQPVAYSSQRQMIDEQQRLVVANWARPGAMESTSTYAEPYPQRFATNVSSPLTPLSPQIYQLVAQSNTQTTNGAFKVQEEMAKDLKNIIEKNFIENNKRVLAEFFNDTNKQPQDITAQIRILSSSLQTQYDSLKNPPRSTSQVARSFSSPQPMRPDEAGEADTKANNYLKLRLNAVIESLSQIESEQTYNEIKQCLYRLVEVNEEIKLDPKNNELLALSYQDSRSSSPLLSPASNQSSTQAREGRAGILRHDPTRRIEELERQNAETLDLLNESQKLFLAENKKWKEANQQIEYLTQSKHEDEQTIYELTTKISSYDRYSARLNLIAQQEIDIASAQETIRTLESQKQQLQSQLTNASQTNESEKGQLNQKLQEKQTEIENHQKKITELESLIVQSKEDIALMNRDIGEIQESLSQNLTEFEDEEAQYASKLQKYNEYSDKIIAEKTVENMTINESKQGLDNELSQLKRTLEISQSLIDQQKTALISDESVISRSHNALAQSEREKRILTVKLTETAEKLTISENARKELTGEKVVEDWLPASGPSVEELTTGDIERFLAWGGSSIQEFAANQEILKMHSRAQQSPTLDQETQTTDLPTQLSQRVDAIAVAGAPSALYIAEAINDTKEQYLHKNTVSQQQASSQQASSFRPAEPQPDSSQPASSQQASLQTDSLPSTSPGQTQNNQSRLMKEMQAGNDLMPNT